MNILLVDDKPNLARVTAVALRTLECRSFIAGTTAAAARLLAAEPIDAVFLDVNLGDENGLDFLAQLRRDEVRIPIIIFTAHDSADLAKEARRLGAFACMNKPFSVDDLRQQLARIEKHRRATAQRTA